MILVVDIGNSEIDFGLYDGQAIRCHFSKGMHAAETSDEIGNFLVGMLKQHRVSFPKIQGIAVSSVVPHINRVVENMSIGFFNRKPFFVNSDATSPVQLRIDNPPELGSDRFASVTAAFVKFGAPCIVVDFGTATTLNVVTKAGWFTGGAILPGLQTVKDALASKTSKLPYFELTQPANFIGKNTIEAMKSGVTHGYIGAIHHLVTGMKAEMREPEAKVIATGGLSILMGSLCPWIEAAEPSLTLEGVGILYNLCQSFPRNQILP